MNRPLAATYLCSADHGVRVPGWRIIEDEERRWKLTLAPGWRAPNTRH
jgi:hypothetical protein